MKLITSSFDFVSPNFPKKEARVGNSSGWSWVALNGGGWNRVETEMSWVEVDEAGWRLK